MATNDIDTELEMTRQFVDFFNSWQGNPWHGRLQKEFDEMMKGNRLILRPVKFNKDAADKLYSNAKVNRVFSVLLDLFDDLPYHPDFAFEKCWRALEILEKMCGFSGDANARIFAACDRISHLFIGSPDAEKVVESLNEACSTRGINFMINKMVDIASLPVSHTSLTVEDISQDVNDVVKNVLGEACYQDFSSKYFAQHERNKATINHGIIYENSRKAMKFVQNFLLTGKEFNLNDNNYAPIDLCSRMKLIVGGIISTSYSYRFNGDFFSPLKSDRSKLSHYYEYYYFLIYSYAMFWYLLYCHLEGDEKFFTLDAVNECIKGCMDNLKGLPNK